MRILTQEFVNHPWWFAAIVASPVIVFLFLLGMYLGHNPTDAPVIITQTPTPRPAPVRSSYSPPFIIIVPRSQPSETRPKQSSQSSSARPSSSLPSAHPHTSPHSSTSPVPTATPSPTPRPTPTPTPDPTPAPSISATPSLTASTPASSPTPSATPGFARFESGDQRYSGARRPLALSATAG